MVVIWRWREGEMRNCGAVIWTLFVLAAAGLAAWLLNLDDVVRASIMAGHLLDWVMGGFCLVWLVVILKLPWDLYFQAHTVAYEIKRSEERGIRTAPGREEYVRRLRRRLGWLAVWAHLASAALVAAVAYLTGGQVGYYFALFYVVSTLFRPAAAAYVYLSRKLKHMAGEARYPREDIVELRCTVDAHKESLRSLTDRIDELSEALSQEHSAREQETREIRQSVHAVGRELETTVSRLTDNQEVIKGIQAFVRLVAQSANN
jgi:hypothetical protein